MGPIRETFWLETAYGKQDGDICISRIIHQGLWALAAPQPDPKPAITETCPFPTTMS